MANEAVKLSPQFYELLVEPLIFQQEDIGPVKLSKVLRSANQLIKRHNKLVQMMYDHTTSQDTKPATRSGPAPHSEEKAMPSGELQSVIRCSPLSETKPTSYDDVMTKFCRCVVPTSHSDVCLECHLPIYDEKED